MAKDPAVLNHQEWLGFVQPVGLVVSIPALLDANARINRNFGPEHQRFLGALPADADGEHVPEIADFVEFTQSALGWSPQDLYGAAGSPPVPDALEAPLPEYNETLRPTYALREFEPKDSEREWILLMEVFPTGTDLDAVAVSDARRWQASPQARFERLLRETRVPAGLLVNGRQIRLVYAPRGESSGYITFKLSDMVQVAGRPIVAALIMLLSFERLYSVAENERLPAILANSRRFQNVVSTQLAGQVLEALYELLRGFQSADDQAQGDLLRDVISGDPNHVYAGLVTTLLRLVFVLYAEDRDLLSADPLYLNHYSVSGLYDRLRADDGRYHDTVDQRYGAWSQLLVLFRLIYQGGSHGGMRIPPREGYLFDPHRYLFLEGRRQPSNSPAIPRVSDGVIFRVLSKLLLLDGERLSYRSLAVEQIGSVYEAIMGFELHVAAGPSIAIKPAKRNGAPATINLEGLVAEPPDKRAKWLAEHTDQKLTGQAAEALKAAGSTNDLLAALDRKIAKAVTPNVVPQGAMIFQPSNERRRSGSHYTPSSLTGPIVESALRPVLKRLGENPTPDQILQLKVCDPAMGSGAFLVEACRQLGERLVKAWHLHGAVPTIPPDEDELLYARRFVAQRCLYGVDKNPMATDLAKLSLWLATLAKDHPFTFLDHSLRSGDSLVGLTREQISAFHWSKTETRVLGQDQLEKTIERVGRYRREIFEIAEDNEYSILLKQEKLAAADQALESVRRAGHLLVAAFFGGEKSKEREELRKQHLNHFANASHGSVSDLQKEMEIIDRLRGGPLGVTPFHWEIEFPEVFTTDAEGQVAGGFDVIVGNPPFAGKNTLINSHREGYVDWLKQIHEESHGNSDLVAHFFRRTFSLLRSSGCFGLIATNTIGQGDTRSTGLRWICTHKGTIYQARKRLKWPGQAAVVVSVVHVCKGDSAGPLLLDGRQVPVITAYLFHSGGHDDPARLKANEGKSFIGTYVLGMGFTFDDTDTKGEANTLAEMDLLIGRDIRNRERIFPFISGEEVNDNPTHEHHRYVINFEDWPLRKVDLGSKWSHATERDRKEWTRSGVVPLDYSGPVAADYPDLLAVVERKVKPERLTKNRENYRKYWWQYAERRPGLARALAGRIRFLSNPLYSPYLSFVFLPPSVVIANKLCAIPLDDWASFAVLQSRPHEAWARFFSATLKDDLAYAPTDCFETYAFPRYEASPTLEQTGREYYEFRAALMVKNNEGLTATYNRFHDPEEGDHDILRLRELHAAMDRAVLDAYGWTAIRPRWEFLLDYEEEEDEEENGPRRRKKPWRYRWPDEIRDEVLVLLLKLNRQRGLEEGQVIAAPKPGGNRSAKGNRRKKTVPAGAAVLFAAGDE